MAKLLHPEGRIIIRVDENFKNFHTFESTGQTIHLERKWNNLNRREVAPVSGTVLSAENIPEGAEILFSHNTVHDVNRIFNFHPLGVEESNPDIKYYSVKETECFLWRVNEGEWQPCDVFATALRVFKPYAGKLQGIEPELLKNVLYVTSGQLRGKAVLTLKACDYVIVFRDSKTGREDNIIRFRPFGDPATERDEEAIAINDEVTAGIKKGKYFVGLTPTTCKPITKHATASTV